ncbi:MAG: 6,7-dimethyl-8-ribityllumazine synthase [Tissierellia bacterium]|nr:6,7-dimethyl-8-ribityllumazine synthase [Tissierellia bacterium]
MKVYEGKLTLKNENARFAIILCRFNNFITEKLLEGALDGLKRCGVSDENIDIYRVPGAFEIPCIAKKLASSKKYQGIISLGAVIRGATPHFEYVSAEVSKGIAKVSMDYDLPVIFGVLTTNTVEQAIERAGTKSGNKGFDAALSCIEMTNLIEQLS